MNKFIVLNKRLNSKNQVIKILISAISIVFLFIITLRLSAKSQFLKDSSVIQNDYFCSLKVIVEIERKLAINQKDEKAAYLVIYMLNNKSCDLEKKVRINKLFFYVMTHQPEKIFQIYSSSNDELKKQILDSLKNPYSLDINTEKIIKSLSLVDPLSSNAEYQEMIKAINIGA